MTANIYGISVFEIVAIADLTHFPLKKYAVFRGLF